MSNMQRFESMFTSYMHQVIEFLNFSFAQSRKAHGDSYKRKYSYG